MTNRRGVGIFLSVAVGLSIVLPIAQPAFALGSSDAVKCYGVNSCKGHGACRTSVNSCKGRNACKAQGFLMTTQNMCDKLAGSTQDPVDPEKPSDSDQRD